MVSLTEAQAERFRIIIKTSKALKELMGISIKHNSKVTSLYELSQRLYINLGSLATPMVIDIIGIVLRDRFITKIDAENMKAKIAELEILAYGKVAGLPAFQEVRDFIQDIAHKRIDYKLIKEK